MKNDKLLHAIGMIDDSYIAEAAPAEEYAIRSKPRRKPHHAWRYASVAACAALVFASVFMLGRNNGVVPPAGSDMPPVSQITPGAQMPDSDYNPVPLTLNRVDAETSADIHIPGHFWQDLTYNQLEAVFPDFPVTLNATAHYRGDGSLNHVIAYEAGQTGSEEAAMFMEYYTLTEIQIAPGEIAECVVYEYDAQISYVNGVAVTAGVFCGNENDGVALYIADFKLDGISYRVKLHDADTGDSGRTRLTELVSAFVFGGGADLSTLSDPVIPKLIDEQLTLENARLDPDFGAYLPESIPSGFAFDSAHRFLNQATNELYAHWFAGYDSISWMVRAADSHDLERIATADERDKYDMSLYSIPFADSVPQELWEVVDCPVFRESELTLDLIRARAYQVNDSGDAAGTRIRFAVLYDGALVEINSKGVSPEDVWNMLRG